MSYNDDMVFTKDNIDFFFKSLAKEYRKQGGGRVPTDIILVGGAAIVELYGFRDMTMDVDAVLSSHSLLKEAIHKVANDNGLKNDWLNFDFKMTESYSPEIRKYSKRYKSFYNVLTVRTLSAEYLIAMKLTSLRAYKNDMSDIVGILWEHGKSDTPITYEMVDTAMRNLYGGWSRCKENAKAFIESVFASPNLEELYNEVRRNEMEARRVLIEFQEQHPNELTEAKIPSILENAHRKKEPRQSVLERLEKIKADGNAEGSKTQEPPVKKNDMVQE